MPDKRERYDGKHSEKYGLPPDEIVNDPGVHQAEPPAAPGELSQRGGKEPLDRKEAETAPADTRSRDEIADQMEEFEGPDRREIRGGPHREPADDPGVAHS